MVVRKVVARASTANYADTKPIKKLTAKQALVAYDVVVSKIVTVRGQRVMFAQDLAELYGVETRV